MLDRWEKMSTCANLLCPCFCDQLMHSFFKAWMVVLFRHSKAARKIVRSKQHTIQIGNRQDLVERLQGGRAFDVYQQNMVLVIISNIFCLLYTSDAADER